MYPKTNQVFFRFLYSLQFCNQDANEKMNRNNYLDAFKESFENLPRDEEIFPLKACELSSNSKIFPSYPVVELQTMKKIDTETLFMIFQYQKDNYERFFASRELKNRGWRFHKKFLMWFKRNSDPRETTETFEKGEFIFFDSSEMWSIKSSRDFTFEYKFME